MTALRRRLPVGAHVQGQGLTHFRVWAPRCRDVDVVIGEEEPVPLHAAEGGYFERSAPATAGATYRYRLDGRELLPDPASRFQPDGPFGPSMVIDPGTFAWTDQQWRGLTRRGQVLYEIHVGTFTPEGTWTAAARQLPALAELGITAIEMLPIADFPGRFGWGYDGVNLFAPTRLYGTPDDLRQFVDRAHALGIGVVLDVVYNHVGPSGAFFSRYSDHFMAPVSTEWGASFNLDGEDSEPVREFLIANAGYWIDEFHMDGLRLDATQAIWDRSEEHLLTAVTRRVRDAGGERDTIVIAENEPQHSHMARPVPEGGYGIDAFWNDDYHHSANVALTGFREAYYTDYFGKPQELISAMKRGFLYQGQWYSWQHARRGRAGFDLDPSKFIAFLENHDQIANSATGARLHQRSRPGQYRALTALTLLGPETPMLFQGQEFASSAPFHYFADHDAEVSALVRAGRRLFMEQFASMARLDALAALPDPSDPFTFIRSKLNPSERHANREAWSLHADLIQLRKAEAAIAAQGAHGFDGAVLAAEAFVLRFFGGAPDTGLDDRLLIVNLGMRLHLTVVPEPLLAPPVDCEWAAIWSSESEMYGGQGGWASEDHGWRLPAESATLLAPRRRRSNGDA